MSSYFTKADDELKWTEQSCKTLLKTVVFDVTERHNTSLKGITGDYVIMNARDWVIVLPFKDNKFKMVKQWRHGEKKLSVEFPGGVIDEGEEPADAARRELLEETGCTAGKLIKLGSVNPNPALFSNHVHIFFASDLTETGIQKLDHDEFINCMELTEAEILNGMGTEEFPHALMGTALAFYFKYKATLKTSD